MNDKTDKPSNDANGDKKQSDKKVEQVLVKDSSADANKSAQQSEVKENKAKPINNNLFSAKPIPKMHSKKSPKKWRYIILAILFIAISVVLSSWSSYQQLLVKSDWQALQQKLETQIEQQSGVIQQIESSNRAAFQAASQTQQQLNRLVSANQQLQDSLISTQEKIKSLTGRQKQDWMLAEAAYLIKIAHLQLTLQKDKETAIQLLKSADHLIMEMSDSALRPLREAIAQDVSDLNLIIEADITGISLALGAISTQITALEIASLGFDTAENHSRNEIKIDGKENIQGVTDSEFKISEIYNKFLRDFVVIKDHSEPVKPLMTPNQRANLDSNIQLAIQQAQIALALNKPTLYRQNLDNALNWSKEFFTQNETTERFIKHLENQKQKMIETRYPSQLKSQLALNQISNQQLYQWLDSSLSNKPPLSSRAAVEKPPRIELPTESNSLDLNDSQAGQPATTKDQNDNLDSQDQEPTQ